MEITMDKTQKLFLEALSASLKNEKVSWTELSPQEWAGLFSLSESHHVLPLIYDAVYSCEAAKSAPEGFLIHGKQHTMQMVMLQTMKTNEFLRLYTNLCEADVKPLVVMGLVCRSLYPNPDYRFSSDEDLLISEGDFEVCMKVMSDFGLSTSESDLSAFELPFLKKDSPLYIELHKKLFSPDSEAYGDFNRFFENAHENAVCEVIDGQEIYTLCPTDHLFYLICHAFKHLLHGGFGIRQVCDIVMFASRYGERIDWGRVLASCKEISADKFAAAMFRIGENNLGFSSDNAHMSEDWRKIEIDETDLLADLLASGIYGGASLSRKHSSNITLDAFASNKNGKKSGNAVIKSLFPPAKALKGRYPYLQKHPYLLPVAWVNRIIGYRKETKSSNSSNASEALQIGKDRVELLKQYGIIK